MSRGVRCVGRPRDKTVALCRQQLGSWESWSCGGGARVCVGPEGEADRIC